MHVGEGGDTRSRARPLAGECIEVVPDRPVLLNFRDYGDKITVRDYGGITVTGITVTLRLRWRLRAITVTVH